MKILHIIYDDVENPWLGGGGAVRALEINKLLAGKHDITVLTGNYPDAKNNKIDNVRYIRAGSDSNYLLSRISFTLLVPKMIKKLDFDILVSDFSAFSPVYSQKYTKKPVIHTFYHMLGKQVFKKFMFLGFLANYFEKKFLKSATNIITISPSVTELIEDDHKNIRCIYTGIDASLFETKSNENGYIAFLGRIDPYMKGLDVLIKAFSILTKEKITLRIAGTGPQKNIDLLKKMTKDLGLNEKVDFIGRISEEEKRTFLQNCRFMVMPSRFEGWGISAIEAAACGKAVIASNIPGLKDAVKDNETGILVEKENVEELADAILKLNNDIELRKTLGKSAREWALNFKWESIAEHQESFYLEMLNNISD